MRSIVTKVLKWSVIITLCFIVNIWLIAPLVKMQEIMSANMIGDKLPDMSYIGRMYKNPLLSLKYLTEENNFIKWFVSSAVLWGFLISLFFITRGANNEDVTNNGKVISFSKDNGTHGTAQWMSMDRLMKLNEYIDIKKGEGIIFGRVKASPKKIVTLPKKSRYNRNVAVFGSPGSRKSRAFARPNIFNLALAGESIICTDPKGELASDTIPMLEEMGYKCKVLNLVNMIHSDRWNPLGEIIDDLSAQTFAQVVIDNTSAPNAKADEFWTRTEMNLLKALALYVTMEIPKENANMATLYSLISTRDAKKTEKIFDNLDDDHPAIKPYNIYKQASETVRTGVVIGLGTRLQIFQSKLVQKVTETSDIDIKLPGVEKCAYFVVVPDSESTFDFIAGLFFSFMFIKLMRMADYNSGSLPIQVNFILDEFPNIAKIPDFVKKISTIRSRGINTFVIFQNIAQLQNRYPNNEWAEILGNCDTQLFLGCNEDITAEFISKALGVATIADYSVSKKQGLDALFDYGTRSDKVGKRMLLNPDEVRKYPNDEAILIMKGENPLRLIKFDYTEHKLAKKMKPKPLKEYHKEWAEEFEYLEKINEEMYSILSIKGKINTDIIPEVIQEESKNEIGEKEIKQEAETADKKTSTNIPEENISEEQVTAAEEKKELETKIVDNNEIEHYSNNKENQNETKYTFTLKEDEDFF